MTSQLIWAIAVFTFVSLNVNAATKADPTAPIGYEQGSESTTDESPQNVLENGMLLQQILIGKGRKIAIVSGRRVREGDQLNSFTVAQINPGSILLEKQNKRRELKLSDAPLKIIRRSGGPP